MSMSKFETFHNNVTVTQKRRAKNPSFSSILLDTIYQSIDDDHHHHHEYSRTTPTSPTQSISNNNIKQTQTEDYCNIIEAPSSSKHQRTRTKMRSDSTLETVDLRRAIMIESWMEKQHHKKQLTQIQTQPPPPLLVPHQQQNNNKHHFHLGDVLDQKIRIVRQKSVPTHLPTTSSASDNITTTATDYSSSSSSSSCFTNLATRSSREQSSSRIFTKTKSRALKIYGDLKRSKQQNNAPISPGRRIAAFLNSIFRNSGNSPARNSPSPSPEMKMNTQTTTTATIASNSTCSSALSLSRSCLSKTTSSSTKSTPATKRSVRFYPVSVIVDEDSRPCGHKSLHKNENEDSKKLVSPQIDSNKWRKEKEIDALMTMMKTNCSENNNNHQRSHVSNFHEDLNDDDEEMEEEEDDDDESCASSDLFELENFSSIGVSRYNEELPVYGTTSLKNITAATT